MKKEKKAKRVKKAKPRKLDSLFLRVFLIVFVCSVGVGVFSQYGAYQQVKAERELVMADISKEEEKKLEFENQKEYYNSDSYIEQIAREQLGMVKPNEMLYINRGQ